MINREEKIRRVSATVTLYSSQFHKKRLDIFAVRTVLRDESLAVLFEQTLFLCQLGAEIRLA